MSKHEELPVKPNLRQGAFSRIDTTRGMKPEDKSASGTPLKKPNIKLIHEADDADKENDQNILNRPQARATKPVADPKSMKPDPSSKSLNKSFNGKSQASFKGQADLPLKCPTRDNSTKQIRGPVKVVNEVEEELKHQLEEERKNVAELKKRLNSEKVIVNSLKTKVKQLEDDKHKMEEGHRRSLVNIEARVATLKNTNLLLLNKAQKYETFTKEMEDIKDDKDKTKDTLK